MANPFHNYAGLLERAPHLIHTYLPNDPAVVAYQFWGAQTPDDAYGNPAASGVGGGGANAMFTVNRDTKFISPALRRRGLGRVDENLRGTTHAMFDMDDYVAPAGGLPPDEGWLFLRVQENRNGVGLLTVPGPLPVLGAIYVVPPAAMHALPKPTFTLQGIAPSAVVGVAAGAVPPFDEDLTTAAPRPLYLVFPVPMVEFTLRNLDGAKDLLVALGPNQIMQTVAAGDEVQIYSGSTKGVVLATAAAGGCPYSIHGVLGRG